MKADNSSSLVMSMFTGCVLSFIVMFIGDGVVTATAQNYDFANGAQSAVKPGLCPSPEEVDSQDLRSDCVTDSDCLGAKKCCKANTGAMLCLKAGSTEGCDVRTRVLLQGESAMVDCYNCTCLRGSLLSCPSYNCSGVHHDATPSNNGSCPTVVDPGECFAHLPCQQDIECSGGQKCCDVQCGVPICIAELQVPDIGTSCAIGDKFYPSGKTSNISNAELDCQNCVCRSDGQWHCQRHLCTAKSTAASGTTRSAVILNGMLILFLVLPILYVSC